MKKNVTNAKNGNNNNSFIPNSLKFISSCIKTASSGVRSATASVAASISTDSHDRRDQVLCASFDKLQLSPSSFKHVLLLGYFNGFQVLNVEDGSNVSEIVSRRDDPVTFLQMQPLPTTFEDSDGFRASRPLLLVVACDESKVSGPMQNGRNGSVRGGYPEFQTGNRIISPTTVRFYSLRSHDYVHALRFWSTVYMVRCSSRIVAVGLAAQVYCFDALTLENKFSVLTCPVPQWGGQGLLGVNVGYGPLAVGPRWVAYASNSPMSSTTGRLSPQSRTPSPGVSPSTSPSTGSLVARFAMESGRQLAAGLVNLGDKSYKTLSKYYQELVPDGYGSSPPVLSSPSRIVAQGVSHATESDVTGMVVIKDFVSEATVSQFRAHASQISALSFDPSGTLLVTASIHGSNINVFRIMPSWSQNGSRSQSYDWSSSHVHLYKLHRGMTPAVIQDICFSDFSQWIAIVSSKGTCHIFALSPFGGETVLQVQDSQVDGPTLLPVLTLPWWSTPSFVVNQRSFSPPPPPPPTVSLSVVSRIKNTNSGWLNIVSNAASSAAGKASIPSGAVAAVFHNSVLYDIQPSSIRSTTLEHLLVYTPSGHLIQYKLLPSIGAEPKEIASRPLPGSSLQIQDEELRVRVEAVQWWDVRRRSDWPEKADYVPGITSRRQDDTYRDVDSSDCEDNHNGNELFIKPHEKSHFYLRNVEVQMNFGRTPIWKKPKMYFYTMNPLGPDEQKFNKDASCGENEMERFHLNEVETRQRDLLPIFHHFKRKPDWSDRGTAGRSYVVSSSDCYGTKEKLLENVQDTQSTSSPNIFYRSSVALTENNHTPNYQNDGKMTSVIASTVPGQSSFNKDGVSVSLGLSSEFSFSVKNNDYISGSASLVTASPSAVIYIAKETGGASDISHTSSNRSDLSINVSDEGPILDSPDFEQYFQEGYCKPQKLVEPQETTEVTDVHNKNASCDGNKSEEDAATDDMLGCVFAFSEEG